jgi:adenosylcobinamide kinase / adenosylcobinamide-phosphate guanylyltransferase
MGKIVLVTGGARSGKSRFAESYAARYGSNIAYIATAEIHDEEMAFRVSLHQKRRPADWQTFEAPFDAHGMLALAGREHDMVLFDCLTLYVSNFLCAVDNADMEKTGLALKKQIGLLLRQAQKNEGTTVFVTNEVGAGIVPENKLARAYRDLAGLVNQWVAYDAEEVYLVTCGLPVDVKKLAENWEE